MPTVHPRSAAATGNPRSAVATGIVPMNPMKENAHGACVLVSMTDEHLLEIRVHLKNTTVSSICFKLRWA